MPCLYHNTEGNRNNRKVAIEISEPSTGSKVQTPPPPPLNQPYSDRTGLADYHLLANPESSDYDQKPFFT